MIQIYCFVYYLPSSRISNNLCFCKRLIKEDFFLNSLEKKAVSMMD
jgi:hypothetical protein